MAGDLKHTVMRNILGGITADRIEEVSNGDEGVMAAIQKLVYERNILEPRLERSWKYAVWVESIERTLRMNTPIRAVHELSGDAFYDDYYSQNRPVHIQQFRRAGAPRPDLDLETLREELGHVVVGVSRGRSLEPRFAPNPLRRIDAIELSAFVDEIQRAESRDCYMTGDARAVAGAMSVLIERYPWPDDILRGPKDGEASIWLGPRGAVTPFHFDEANVFIVALFGKKRVFLVPPYDYCYMHATAQVSEIDFLQPDWERHPLYRFATVSEVVVGPGEALFIPVGWWHGVVVDEPALTVSIASFQRQNRFPHVPL